MMSTASCWKKLCALLPGGVSSPVRSGKYVGVTPPIMYRGIGPWIEDIEGKRYIDCCLSWGALLHGHAHPQIVSAAQAAVADGSTFGTATPYELMLGEKIRAALPSMEKIRFVSTGSEATMSAVRVARAYTKRKKIIKCIGNYHGHADQFLVQAGSGVALLEKSIVSGVPQEFTQHTICLPYNDLNAFATLFSQYKDEIAAIILEPVAANMGVVLPEKSFLQGVRTLSEKNNALLIFDEVITGFRVGWTGAQGLYEIQPDLTCLGKIIGGGFPAAAFGGKKEIMDLLAPLGDVYQAGTLSGNPVAMRAGYEALSLASHPHFYENLEHKADIFLSPIKMFFDEKRIPACIQRVGSMFTLFFGTTTVHDSDDLRKLDNTLFAKFFSYMLSKGIYIPPAHNEAWFISSAHEEEHLSFVRKAILDFFIR